MNPYDPLPTNLRALALDMASITGWAVLASGVLTSGSRDFRRHAGNKSRGRDHIGASHAMFSNWLDEMCVAPRFDHVIYEDAGFFKSAAAVQICVGLRGVLLAKCAKLDIPIFCYAPASVKKFFTSNGRAEKSEMMAVCRKRWPDLILSDENEADALALMTLHLDRLPKIQTQQQLIPA